MEFHRYPTLLTQHTHARMKRVYEMRKENLRKIKNKKQARSYQVLLQKKIKRCFGIFPKKTLINAIIAKSLDYLDYTVECIKYESRPDFWVSANLYLPKNKIEKIPAVLLPCGHNQSGKGANLYVMAAVRLVQAGYAVLVYDPINQGERKIYSLLGFPQEKPNKFNATIGHNHIGKQLRACGESLCSWMVWDGIRGLDYLFTRPEIDSTKIGVTGNSGGGALSAYLWALDKRIKMVASSCWATSYLCDIENEMPGDNEQYPKGILAEGLDKIDFFMARAGEPVILLGQERDFFDDRGLKEGYQELLRFHLLLGGNSKSCQLQMDVVTHSYSPTNQIALVKFFNQTLGINKTKLKQLPKLPIEIDLLVTKTGDLQKENSKPIYELISKHAKDLGKNRLKNSKDQLINTIFSTLKFEMPKNIPPHRRTHGEGRWNRYTANSKFRVYRFVVESEPNIFLPLRHITNNGGPFRLDPEKEINLYLPDLSSQLEMDEVKGQNPFWILDVRGMGEGLFVEDDTKNYYGMEYLLAGHELMFNETLLGKRIFDVLSVINLFEAEGVKKIHLHGNGQGSMIALISALIDSRITKVSCRNGPESIEKLVSSPVCYWLDVNFPFNVLRHFDLPDIRKALGKKLMQYLVSSPIGLHYH